MNKILLPVVFFCIATMTGYSQTPELDSFYKAVDALQGDSAKIRFYNKTASGFLYKDIKIADRLLREGLTLAKEKHFLYGLTELTNTRGIYMDIRGMLTVLCIISINR